jgi:prephenate dehydratase
MSFAEIYCPAGERSQTGSAADARYPNIDIKDCGGIDDAENFLITGDEGPFLIPIWNSNQGEVKSSEYVWELIESAKIKILDLWPKTIEFWFVIKKGSKSKYGKVGSVFVAETQCIDFLKSNRFILEPYPLTTDAFAGYKEGDHLDGVLVAPGQGDEDGYSVEDKQTANENNFTSFVTLTNCNSTVQNCKEIQSWLTGVTIGNLSSVVLDDEQASFFEKVFQDSFTLSEIPKLVFVFKRIDKVGLLFEGENYEAGDFLDAEQLEAGDILVHENVGELEIPYTEELHSLLSTEHQKLLQSDFILHRGVNTVLFACPTFGMYTHGFAEKTVEPVVRFYIDKIFEFIDNGGRVTNMQNQFFKKHEGAWKKGRSNFPRFKVI